MHPHTLLGRVLIACAPGKLGLKIPELRNPLKQEYRHLRIIAVGKAAPWMASGCIQAMADVCRGVGIAPRGMAMDAPGWTWFQADHPMPGPGSITAGRAASQLARETKRDDLLLVLLSGGASALMVSPLPGVSLQRIADLTRALLRRGATIHELNAVRRSIDKLKGGGLARLAAPGRLLALIISDVPGNHLPDIGSGPTVGCPDHGPSPRGVLEKYGLLDTGWRETLNPLNQVWPTWTYPRSQTIVIGSNDTALRACGETASTLGYRTKIYPGWLSGEAQTCGARLAEKALEQPRQGPPYCLVFGGETSVTVTGHGTGGRNLELAMGFALRAQGKAHLWLMTLATDGKDGSAPAAGAIVSGSTILDARACGLDPHATLDHNDSFSFLSRIKATLCTGPTGTNVADLAVALVLPQ